VVTRSGKPTAPREHRARSWTASQDPTPGSGSEVRPVPAEAASAVTARSSEAGRMSRPTQTPAASAQSVAPGSAIAPAAPVNVPAAGSAPAAAVSVPAPVNTAPASPAGAAERRPPGRQVASAQSTSPQPHPAKVPETPEAIYARAERAMKDGDLAEARRSLERFVSLAPGNEASSALYELARLDVRVGDRAGAVRTLERLLGLGGGPLREPASFLRCRAETDRGQAAGCFRRFLREYPRSAHAAEAAEALKQ
jgi:TolA-binding protein